MTLSTRDKDTLEASPVLAKNAPGINAAALLDQLSALGFKTNLELIPNGTARFVLLQVPRDADYSLSVSGLRWMWPVAPSSAAGTILWSLQAWDESAGTFGAIGANGDVEAQSAGWNDDAVSHVLAPGDFLVLDAVSNNADLVNGHGAVEVVATRV